MRQKLVSFLLMIDFYHNDWNLDTREVGYTEFLKGWAGALEGAYEAYLDGEYFEHQEEMAVRHERYSELLTKFIEKLK